MDKVVYSFNENLKNARGLTGDKGEHLAEMTKLGLSVPFGFIVTSAACAQYHENGRRTEEELLSQVFAKVQEIEAVTGKSFGGRDVPLLLSVRTDADVHIPGLMDTILNVGLNDDSVVGLEKLTGNRSFAMESYLRFLRTFGNLVMGVPESAFEGTLYEAAAEAEGERQKLLIDRYKKIIREHSGEDFPQNPQEQLARALRASFDSWESDKTALYRSMNGISQIAGSAVTVQAMVFGNIGANSGAGSACSRNPIDGSPGLFGEFLADAQGEDVEERTRTPLSIEKMAEIFPEAYRDFMRIAEVLEHRYKDMQYMEFTVENGKLYMLQTAKGQRTAQAAVRIAVDMVKENLIDYKTAIMRITPEQIDMLLHPTFVKSQLEAATPITAGVAASPGAACGKLCFNAEDAVAAAERGERVILIKEKALPEDLAGIVAAQGVLTVQGGIASHAAVVARGMGKCCITGCSGIYINENEKFIIISGRRYGAESYLSLDGMTGKIYKGVIETETPEISGDFARIMDWADDVRKLKVRANANNAQEAAEAVKLGAEGIGLCRTEHMFFDESGVNTMRRMLMAKSTREKSRAIRGIKQRHKDIFKDIFRVMGERPVTVRLMDAPVAQFLPQDRAGAEKMAEELGLPYEKAFARLAELQERNPVLGNRGCRLAITTPVLTIMQTEAIMEAAAEVIKEDDVEITPEIMVPLVESEIEFRKVKDTIVKTAKKVMKAEGVEFDYAVGTMIETPRSALIADRMAEEAEFFSFGTNDLTQLAFGFSRDDTGKLIDEYIKRGVLNDDPFRTLDTEGVGKLISMAASLGRQSRPRIKLGICGEHGSDPRTIDFCNDIDLNYVSCSYSRVPVSRFAAAQSVIRKK